MATKQKKKKKETTVLSPEYKQHRFQQWQEW